MDSYFPILIEYLGRHGLEDSAEEGKDYWRYALITHPQELPQNHPFKILATKVRIFDQQ